jgi:alpha-tubulin suppressor-like RCC1 family protein
MNILDVSKLGNRWKGTFSSTASYNKGDVVRVGDKTQVFTDSAGTKIDFAVGQVQFTQKGQVAANQTDFPVGRSGQEFHSVSDGSGGFKSEFRHDKERNGTRVVSLTQDAPSRNVGCIYVGGYSPTFTMTDGTLRGYGEMHNGALGKGAVSQNRKDPVTIPLPFGKRVKKHWTPGYRHLFVLDEDNVLYGSGYQWSGQGTGTTATVYGFLRPISHDSGDDIQEEITTIVGGYDYQGYNSFMALGVSGKVYAWGTQRGSVYPFGLPLTSDYERPTLIPWTADRPIKRVFNYAGYYPRSFLIDFDGKMYCAGQNSRNLLGTNTTAYDPSNPTTGHQLFDPWGAENAKVKWVMNHSSDGHWAAGTQYYCHTAITLEDGRCYVVGNGNNQVGWQPNGGWTYGWNLNANYPFHTGVEKLMTKNGGYASAVALMKDGTIEHNGASYASATNTATGTNHWQKFNQAATAGYNGPDLNNVVDLQGLGARYGEKWAVRQADGKMFVWGINGQGGCGTGNTSTPQNGGTTNGAAGISSTGQNTGHHTYALLPANIVDFRMYGYATDATDYANIVALDDTGQAWSWGYGAQTTNQDDDNEDNRTPRKLRF